MGPLPKAPGAVKYLLVAIDFFTKWKHLICRYDLPYAIVMDNDTQFKAQTYEDFLIRHDVKHLVTSVEHPQTND